MKIAAVLVASTMLAAPGAVPLAAAQPGLAAPGTPPVIEGDKSPGLALGLAIGGTAGGAAALAAGFAMDEAAPVIVGFGAAVIGPSLGHFYAGEVGNGVIHSGARVGGALLVVAGLREYWGNCRGQEGDHCDSTGPVLVGVGALIGISSAVYSIIDAPRAARRRNESGRRHVVVTPAAIPGPERSTGLGLQVGARF